MLPSCRGYTATDSRPLPHTEPPSKRFRLRGLAAFLGLTGGALTTYYLYDPEGFRHNRLTVIRSYRALKAGALAAADYKWSLRNGPEVVGEAEYEDYRSQCHQRAADRLLELCKANQGIYIKLGQHIAALVYLLPSEYTETMRPLQDKCPPTPLEDIEGLFKSDLGRSLDDLFSEFDPEPLGVASLAQVHRATMKNGQEVAVKIQHPYLDEYTPVDIATVVLIVKLIKKVFPEFEFGWLAEEMQQSLPQELDFVHEAENANKVRSLFHGSAFLKIPEVYWADRRVLIMEFVAGGKIDDLDYYKRHNIDPRQVSSELSKIYSEMMFVNGFVHCDPHRKCGFVGAPARYLHVRSILTASFSNSAGNVFVRPRSRPFLSYIPILRSFVPNPTNFEIVLLDHGLYRQLTPTFRLDYAHLWAAILAGDENGIFDYSYRLFTSSEESRRRTGDDIDYHRLFASMLTGRSWDVISDTKGGIAQARSQREFQVIRQKASTGRFFFAIADILAKLPRELLLLLKTHDLLRSVDSALEVSHGDSIDHMLRSVAIMGWYCALAIKQESIREMVQSRLEHGNVVPVWLDAAFWSVMVEFWKTEVRVGILEWWIWWRSWWRSGSAEDVMEGGAVFG
ncbi:putative aarF domain-containing protein kinase 1 [Gaertneriomyces sp. JEL0708]|nr:putative aarF domain-containing protein kinase 1 [Gaertneriomyces sp. JEL0708]